MPDRERIGGNVLPQRAWCSSSVVPATIDPAQDATARLALGGGGGVRRVTDYESKLLQSKDQALKRGDSICENETSQTRSAALSKNRPII
jgi:hypothetical protein